MIKLTTRHYTTITYFQQRCLTCFVSPPTLKLLMLNCIFPPPPPTFGEAQPAPTRDRIDAPGTTGRTTGRTNQTCQIHPNGRTNSCIV